jgi:hypothetical protein
LSAALGRANERFEAWGNGMSSNTVSGKSLSLRAEYAAYDRLPKAIKKRLQESPIKYAAIDAARLFKQARGLIHDDGMAIARVEKALLADTAFRAPFEAFAYYGLDHQSAAK